LPPAKTASPLLGQVLESMGYPSPNSVCLDITRFLNDKALAYFLLQDASDAQLQQCMNYYHETIEKQKEGQWDASDVFSCAIGDWSGNAKETWDNKKDMLKEKLYNHLKWVEGHYSTSIAMDNVPQHFVCYK
jgi:phage I-like protein